MWQVLDAAAALKQGLSHMEEGEWEEAAHAFTVALHSSKTQQQLSTAAQYLTAVRLLEAQVRARGMIWKKRCLFT